MIYKNKKDVLKNIGFSKIIFCLNKLKTFTEIRKETLINPTTLSLRLNYMVEEELIQKVIDPIDLKPKYCLTEKGKRLNDLSKIIAIVEEIYDDKQILSVKKTLLLMLTKDDKKIISVFRKIIKEKLEVVTTDKEIGDIFSLVSEKLSSL